MVSVFKHKNKISAKKIRGQGHCLMSGDFKCTEGQALIASKLCLLWKSKENINCPIYIVDYRKKLKFVKKKYFWPF